MANSSRAKGEHMNTHNVVFLFDMNNTVLDNDRITADLQRVLECEVSHERQQRHWPIFKHLRNELGYADYLGKLQRYRLGYPYDSYVFVVSNILVKYPFANRLFPNRSDTERAVAPRKESER